MNEVDRQQRADRLLNLAREVGLTEALPVRFAKPNANDGEDYDKLFTVRNVASIRSVEVWYPKTRAPYLKVTHGKQIATRWKELLDKFASSAIDSAEDSSSGSTFITVRGDHRKLMACLASTLRPWGLGAEDLDPRDLSGWHDQVDASPQVAADVSQAAVTLPAVATGDAARVLRDINERILRFVEQPENVALLAQTRSFSTPFRGKPFGKLLLTEVAAESQRRRLDVLVIAANPNADAGSDKMAGFGSLREQIQSGYFGEAYFDTGRRPRPGWSPRDDPKLGWRRLFSSIDAAGLDVEAVAMANFLPWGSAQLDDFAKNTDPMLLQRVIAFANTQLEQIVALFKPKVIVTVRSISETPGFSGTNVASWRRHARHVEMRVPTAAGISKPVNLYVGEARFANVRATMIHIQHPGYLRLAREAEPVFERNFASLLTEASKAIRATDGS